MSDLLPEIRQHVADALARLGNSAAVADAYALPEEAVRRVSEGRGLRAKNYQAFVTAFGLDRAPPDAATVISRAAQQTRRNLVRLSEISGYAKRVLEEMRSVTASQERVVEQLAPYVMLEEEVYGDPGELADTAEDIRRDAEAKQARRQAPASPPRKRKSGG